MEIVDRHFLNSDTTTVHASTVAFHKGHLVFSWFGGSREGAPDVSIYINNLNNDNKNIVIGNKDSVPRWNPILFTIKEDIFLFEKLGSFCDRWISRLHCISDWNNDITEKEINNTAKIFPAGLNGSVKTKPIIYKDIMLCGSSVENFMDWSSYCEVYKIPTKNNMFNFVGRSNPIYIKDKEIYRDLRTGCTRNTIGILQPSVYIKDDIAHALFRSQCKTQKIYYSFSKEYPFLKWEDPIPTEFDNPNSGIDTIFFNNFLYLVYNPSNVNRFPLCVSKLDENMKIIDNIIINDSPKIENGSMEFSYPFLIENNGLLHLVYTFQRRKIEHVIIQV